MIYDLWYDMISYTYLHQSDWIGVYGLCIPVAHLISRFGETVSGQNHISSFCSVASNFDHSVHNVFESSQMRWSEHVTNLTKAYPREGCVLDHLAVNSDVRAINTPSIVASHTSCWCWSLAKHTCTQRHTHTYTPPSPSIKRFPGELFSRSHPVSKQKEEVVGVALVAAEGKSRKERGRSVSRLEGFLVRLINPSTHPWGVHHGSRREAYCRTFIFSTQNRLGLVFCLGQLLPTKGYDPVKSTWIHHVQWGIHLAKRMPTVSSKRDFNQGRPSKDVGRIPGSGS